MPRSMLAALPVIVMASAGASLENPGGRSKRVAVSSASRSLGVVAAVPASACGWTCTTFDCPRGAPAAAPFGVREPAGTGLPASGAVACAALCRGASDNERFTVWLHAPSATTTSGRSTCEKPVRSAASLYSPGGRLIANPPSTSVEVATRGASAVLTVIATQGRTVVPLVAWPLMRQDPAPAAWRAPRGAKYESARRLPRANPAVRRL